MPQLKIKALVANLGWAGDRPGAEEAATAFFILEGSGMNPLEQTETNIC